MRLRWLRHLDELVVDGTNARMRQCLESGTGPSLPAPTGYTPPRSSHAATDTARQPDRTPTAPSAPPSQPSPLRQPRSSVLYISPQPLAAHPIGYGVPVPRSVERWICDAEGTA